MLGLSLHEAILKKKMDAIFPFYANCAHPSGSWQVGSAVQPLIWAPRLIYKSQCAVSCNQTALRVNAVYQGGMG